MYGDHEKKKTSLLIYISLALLVLAALTSVYFAYNILKDFYEFSRIYILNKADSHSHSDFDFDAAVEMIEKTIKIEIINGLPVVVKCTYFDELIKNAQ